MYIYEEILFIVAFIVANSKIHVWQLIHIRSQKK